MTKPGDVVVVIAHGREENAIVLSTRVSEVSHLGKSGEPLVTVALRKAPLPNQPHKVPTSFQAAVAEPEIEIMRDVVHVSHEFDEDFKKKHGSSPAQIASQRGHGEWKEFVGDHEDFVAELRSRVFEAEDAARSHHAESRKQAARADLAESIAESLRKELSELKTTNVPPPQPPAQS